MIKKDVNVLKMNKVEICMWWLIVVLDGGGGGTFVILILFAQISC